MRNDNIKFKDIFWNTLGTVAYSLISLCISVVIINLVGKIEGGIFSFGFSTLAHFVFIIAYFGIRPHHIVDVKYRYCFKEYIAIGNITFFVSILVGFLYIGYFYINGNYSAIKSLLLLILVLHGAIDGLADFYECEYQRANKLYIGGQNLFFRIMVFTLTLIITLKVTENLLLSEILALVFEIIIFYILNVLRSRDVFKNAYDTTKTIKDLFLETLPLFLIAFFDMYLFFATKFAIDAYLNDSYSGFYNLIFMPTNAIYLVMNLFMKPVLTPLSNSYHNDKKEYNKLLLKILFVGIIISLIFIVGTIICGDIYINIIYFITQNIYSEYYVVAKRILVIVMCAGCLYAVTSPIYYGLIVEKKQTLLCIIYALSCVISFFVSRIFVMNLGITGASYAHLVNMFILFIGIGLCKLISL